MRIAVTGASGFIGRHVVRSLHRLPGHRIVAMSRREIDLPEGVEQVSLAIGQDDDKAFELLGRPDVLIHLAWGGLPHYLSLHHFEQELPAHYRFLKQMAGAGLASMVVAGTCYEYGMVDGELEEGMADRPANPYAFAKSSLHRQLQFLQADQPFALTWARLFYMWGEGQAKNSLFPLLQSAVIRGDEAFPMSRGEQLRDYLPVDDVASAIVSLALAGGGHGLVNVCSGKPVSIRALVEQWITANGWDIELELGRYPYPTYEPLAFWGSRAKLEACLEAMHPVAGQERNTCS